ncbi:MULTISPECIES: 1-acyl-sn-glycerol-3-phosphate acyltransferase [Nocardioides]|jgi:1-acyl-sn-glycerol-3-phosphate acyltransferase|uniref:1-acyl-sn-glycerol-3-phosphate acyltransferase n=1 Tax=Nocardioides TaxID=1839 RepID=UPI00032DEB24|nr:MULTISPECIES: 1-acyl-sn-glycerol-3-phosphate acyltransferase [Nocardioides]EON24049.1 phospholipid/glycerol acyltransferase [Nocardioides sp. CF8]
MSRHFLVRRTLARVLLRLFRWRTAGQVPQRGILVGAPHTSNWDWVLTMLLAWDSQVQIRLLVKKEFFKGILGPILRSTGAVALDRSDPTETINTLLAEAEVEESFLLGLAAEGTRSKSDYWKSGFYRISQKTGIPVTLAYIDSVSRTVGWGPTFELTGDVKADMDRVREFYADKRGIRPELTTEPRLREEDKASG